MVWDTGPTYLLHVNFQFFRHHWLKWWFSPPLTVFATMWKVNWQPMCSLLCELELYSIKLHISHQLSHCCDQYGIVVIKLRRFKIVLAAHVPSVSLSTLGSADPSLGKAGQMEFWILIETAWNLCYRFGEYCHFSNIKSSSPWHWNVFPFI